MGIMEFRFYSRERKRRSESISYHLSRESIAPAQRNVKKDVRDFRYGSLRGVSKRFNQNDGHTIYCYKQTTSCRCVHKQ